MANNENLIPIPGRLHSVATEGHVSGADEIYDDTQQKNQETINSELIAAVGTGGSVDTKIANAINALDASVSQSAGNDGLALSVIEVNGKVTAISGSIASNTYDAYGSASSEAARAGNAETALGNRITTLETAVGTGGSVDSRIAAAKAEIKGNATSACDTLGEAEALISAETSRAQAAEADRYTKSETYTKTEVNGLVDTPHQEYETVEAYTDLPATGSKDTIYRVSNYNGSTSQVDASVYSEYAWDGNQYVFLCVKSQIGEVFDISVYNNNAKYADLAAALNGGANIPQSLQKGGMSVKFVQSSDNKYIQARLMADEFTTDVTKWQGVDDEPTDGSKNLVQSGGVYLEINSVKNTVAGIGRFAVVNHWIYAITDATGKVVLGIKENGGVFVNGFVNNIIVAKDGSGDYDNLSQAIIDTYGKKNVVLNILPGVYNIIEEMKELYGDDYWDNYDRNQKIIYPDMFYDYGLRLGNGIVLKGSSGTHIICKYTGNNDNVKVYFSPFNTDTRGFKMINLSIECSNVRYCVHDERGIDTIPYEAIYDSCYMESSNSTEASSPWKSNACIGGGLGINGHIKVTNCVFNSTVNDSALVSYHDSSGDFTVYSDERNIGYVSPQNYVICSGNYIKGQNEFRFTYNSKNGESKTKILCYGNNVGRQTYIGKESSAVSHDCDIEVLEWNNVIRNI